VAAYAQTCAVPAGVLMRNNAPTIAEKIQADAERRRELKRLEREAGGRTKNNPRKRPRKQPSIQFVEGSWQATFFSTLPAWPYCANRFDFDHKRRSRQAAIAFLHLQVNRLRFKNWMVFDLDFQDAAEAFDHDNVAVPNLVMENPKNGHAHYAYRLEAGVGFYFGSRLKPQEYFADVEYGYTLRLRADQAYAGHLTKNPLSSAWRVSAPRHQGYTLRDLANWLEPHEMRRPKIETGIGACGTGRNVTLFNSLRVFAYDKVLGFKADLANHAAYRGYCDCLHAAAMSMNLSSQFQAPLHYGEVRSIVRSVAAWTWRNFSAEEFSRIQKARINKRWDGHVSAESTEPWKANGISRATYYRRRRKG
jgi:hypothetical protein